VLPEIIASLFFGKVMEHVLHNDRLMAVRIGGALLCIAAVICALIIKENKNEPVNEALTAELEILEQRPV
jgi:maltose/moltooligosaccharide transporter